MERIGRHVKMEKKSEGMSVKKKNPLGKLRKAWCVTRGGREKHRLRLLVVARAASLPAGGPVGGRGGRRGEIRGAVNGVKFCGSK